MFVVFVVVLFVLPSSYQLVRSINVAGIVLGSYSNCGGVVSNFCPMKF